MTNVIQASELIEADGQMPQSCQTGNLLHLAQTVTMEVQHLQAQTAGKRVYDVGWSQDKSESAGFFSTHSDLTEDVCSGDIQQDFVIQAQQSGLRLQHRFHVQDFLVIGNIVGNNIL